MERADASFGFIVVWESILLPLPVPRFAIETNVGVNIHPVVGQHPFVDTVPNFLRNWLRCRWIEKQMTRLEDQHHTRPQIPAASLLVGRRGADNEHLAIRKRKLP